VQVDILLVLLVRLVLRAHQARQHVLLANSLLLRPQYAQQLQQVLIPALQAPVRQQRALLANILQLVLQSVLCVKQERLLLVQGQLRALPVEEAQFNQLLDKMLVWLVQKVKALQKW
jgi:hypothetical protein